MTIRSQKVSLNRRVAEVSAVLQCRSVALAEASVPEAPAAGALVPAVWVQVTAEGDFKGYPGGRFKFDRPTFDTIVANFHKHPSYNAGSTDVVPWDFHHASEFSPSDGTIPVSGAPAQGWVRELEVRNGPDGEAQLWALTRWLEPARSYIKDGRYKWASVVVDFGARNAETNEKLGPTLVSVAITNNPFVEGMAPLVAASKDRRVAAGSMVGNIYVEPACSPEDVLDKLRSVLGMPGTRPVGEVIAELVQLQEWALNGGQPLGVDLEQMIGAIRVILNMRALASVEEVFAEASTLLQRLLESAAIGNPDSSLYQQPSPLPPADMMPAASRRNQAMLIKILASKLLVQENDAAVTQAVESLLEFRSLLCKLAGLETGVSDKRLLDAGAGVADARAKLLAILGALGVEDGEAGIEKIAQIMEQAASLTAVMPELTELRAAKKKVEEEGEVKDVEEALASKGLSDDDGMRMALTAFRKSDPAKFAEKYPKQAPTAAASGPAAAHLTKSVATTKTGQEQRIEITPTGQLKVLSSKMGKADQGDRIKLTGFSGRNTIEKVMAYLRANGHEKASHDDVWALACQLVKSGKVEVEAA